ncbi:aminoglycoside phosphotransferase family protein [Oceanobacillus neutriphilus]|uniref:Aminoglycoside phosphotransferase domain-containing protein n=1 Tax=Oceanobacillus neutriphilus TaxID=531815 RepID=A0ABQ2NST7_9BACI|nr:aminoglycoside phosphotransferase family protein [Oceanobacillus neutriphilus]GGP09897.1 hypothetical protein GCM10011346_15840 [Oceanobacillus neutriphilus]
MNTLTVMLQTEYDINPIQIQSKQGGWASLAFEIKADEAVYFLKVYEKSRASTPKLTALIDQYVPIVEWIERNSNLKGRIPVPMQTREGNYKCDDEENIYLLYPFINGQTIGEWDLTERQTEELAHIIAVLHSFDEEIPFPTEALIEDFEVPFIRELEKVLDYREEDVPEELHLFLRENRERINKWISSVKELSTKLKSFSLNRVLCHTDLHHWNLMQAENLLLIDWEGLKLAPAEADMMFLTSEPYFMTFMKVYRQYHKNYHINEEAITFYQLKRRLEDIWEFIEQLLYEKVSTKDKDEIIGYLKGLTEHEK